MTQITFISHDVVGSAMAGPGIRAAELAGLLAREHRVTLATPRPADWLPAGVQGLSYQFGDAASLAPALQQAELLIANGSVLGGHPELEHCPVPLVLDLYDPTPLENLALFRERDAMTRLAHQQADVGLLLRQLRAADCILCATERQRDLYLGALLAVGRVRADIADVDPVLRGLLRVVSFGLPAVPPQPSAPPWPALEPDALVLLWSGGLWDWMDPLTLLRAMPQVLEAVPQVRLVFLAGNNPSNPHPMQMPERARALALELGLLDRAVLFVDHWLPYAERAGALLGADLAVYLHAESLESSYAAVRSRFLDHLWAGLPSLVSAGDAAAGLVLTHGLGRVVPPGDVAATAAALIALLQDAPTRRACAERARALAGQYTWQQVAAPLLEFCRAPQRAPDRPLWPTPPAAAGPAAPQPALDGAAARDRQAQAADAPRNAALRAATASRLMPEPAPPRGLLGRLRRLLADQLVRPFVAPLLAQQQVHNDAVLRALDALAESADARRSELYTLVDRLDVVLDTRLHDAERQGAHHASVLAALNAELARLRQALAEVEGRLADLDDADTTLAAQLAGLAPPLERG